MNNRQRRKERQQQRGRPAAGAGRSCSVTTREGAKAYDEETLKHIASLVPGVEIVHPLGVEDEIDKDRLARARAMARYHRRIFGAVVRADCITTVYFQDLVLGEAHEIHVMRSKVKHVGAATHCPFGTIIVVFKPGHQDRIENGLCPIYWERASA